MRKLLIAVALMATSIGVFAADFVAKAVYTNNVSALVSANDKLYLQHVGGAMIDPNKVHHQVWIYSN